MELTDENTSIRVQDVIDRIKEQYGDNSAQRSDEEPPVGRISTRSLELDYATGGGIPIGRWSRFYGGYSSGKSTKCWHVIAEAQSMGLICAYYNAEKQFTAKYAQSQGVDTHNLVLVQGTVIEDIGEIMEGNMEHVDLHVVDSCSSCISRVELKDGLNEREYIALRPKKWAQQFAFINERFDQTRNSIILVDQIRKKGLGQGLTFDGPPGGSYMEHVSSMSLMFKRGSWLWYKEGVLQDERNTKQKTLSGTAEADGVEIKAKVEKSRVSRPLRSANMKFDLNTLKFDHIDELVKAAKYFGVVEGGSWIKIPGEEKSIRPKEFRFRLENDAELRNLIWSTMMGHP